MKQTPFCQSAVLIKSAAVILLLLLRSNAVPAQQRHPFSEKTVDVKDRTFLPFTKGEVVRKISGTQKPVLDQICSIITAWDSIAPPQGIKVFCSGFENSLDIYFLPYLFEDGIRVASEGGPMVSVYVNDPLRMFGHPVVSDIFLCPQKTADFNGFPIYCNGRQEVTIVSGKKIPLFVPVSQEEYLKVLIAKEEKANQTNPGSDYQSAFREMEKAYQQLLKTDKEAANEFKLQMDEFKAEIGKNGNEANVIDPVALLKQELAGLSAEGQKQQAWFSGASAVETYKNASGLVPFEDRHNAHALVRYNPSLIEGSSKDQVQLLVICWSVGESIDSDKPRVYKEGRAGFHLAHHLMSQLYLDQKIWAAIFQICK
jgi:hypothetical protein